MKNVLDLEILTTEECLEIKGGGRDASIVIQDIFF